MFSKSIYLFSRCLYLLVEVVLVLNLEDDERSMCVWLLLLGAKMSIKSSFCAFKRSDVPGKNSSVRSQLPTLTCWSGRKQTSFA